MVPRLTLTCACPAGFVIPHRLGPETRYDVDTLAMAYLILVRHGMSEYNKGGLWTGQTDVDLAPEGREEARRAGEAMRGLPIDIVHISTLRRTHQTFEEIKATLGLDIEHTSYAALNERDYGIHTGKHKAQVKEEIGEKEFHRVRRVWDAIVPGGENLRDVHARVAPYFESHVRPALRAGSNVLIVAHGNSLRALVKHLEGITDDEVQHLEIGYCDVHCYQFDEKGEVVGKTLRAVSGRSKSPIPGP